MTFVDLLRKASSAEVSQELFQVLSAKLVGLPNLVKRPTLKASHSVLNNRVFLPELYLTLGRAAQFFIDNADD